MLRAQRTLVRHLVFASPQKTCSRRVCVCVYPLESQGAFRIVLEKAGGNPTLQLIAQRRGLQVWLISGRTPAGRTCLVVVLTSCYPHLLGSHAQGFEFDLHGTSSSWSIRDRRFWS